MMSVCFFLLTFGKFVMCKVFSKSMDSFSDACSRFFSNSFGKTRFFVLTDGFGATKLLVVLFSNILTIGIAQLAYVLLLSSVSWLYLATTCFLIVLFFVT